MSAPQDLTNEQLLNLLRERGLATTSIQAQQPVPQKELGLSQKLNLITKVHKEQIQEAKSVRFIPQGAKTELLDVAMDQLLTVNG